MDNHSVKVTYRMERRYTNLEVPKESHLEVSEPRLDDKAMDLEYLRPAHKLQIRRLSVMVEAVLFR